MGHYKGSTWYRDRKGNKPKESKTAMDKKREELATQKRMTAMDKKREELATRAKATKTTANTPVAKKTSSAATTSMPLTNMYVVNPNYRPGIDGPSSGLVNLNSALNRYRMRKRRGT